MRPAKNPSPLTAPGTDECTLQDTPAANTTSHDNHFKVERTGNPSLK